ncbi:MAG TPA: homoserine O-acetyltransferase [Acidimicrobiia bacterium]
MSESESEKTSTLDIGAEFPLESGDSLPDVTVAYRTWGEPRSEATLICHALTGNADADDWWGGMFGPGRTFDPESEYVVATNVLGGCYGTTGPTSVDPRTGDRYMSAFPAVTIRDMVNLQALFLERLGVERLNLVIGGSMGGMQATEFGASFPDRVRSVVSIGAGVAQSAWGLAFAAPQRAAIVNDPEFAGGHYTGGAGPSRGLATARMIAMVSYRGHDSFEARFGRRISEDGYEVQTYLGYQGQKLVERFDANSYLSLLGAMDSHDLARGRGEMSDVLNEFTTPLLAIGISTDVLFPPHQVRDLADATPNGRYATLHTPQGHDGFLIEEESLNRIVSGFKKEVLSGLTPLATSRMTLARGAAWA